MPRLKAKGSSIELRPPHWGYGPDSQQSPFSAATVATRCANTTPLTARKASVPDEFARLNRALDDFRAGRPALVCEECGEQSTGAARGWRAYLTIDHLVAINCTNCARAELEQD